MLKEDIESFPKFAQAVFGSLLHEALTDPELLILTTSGLCIASRRPRIKGLGIALGGWYISRRVDQHMFAFDSKMRLLALVIDASNSSKEANGH